jgi:anti-sigma regulatory factor (Ser/Thr protein kinase)
MKRTLDLENDLKILDPVHDALLEFLGACGAGAEVAEEMFLVAEELLVNTISYGYEDKETHRIGLELSCEGGRFRMRFTDDGVAFDPLQAEEPDLDAPMAKRRIGGLGIHLVRTLTDGATYTREGGKNVLTIER